MKQSFYIKHDNTACQDPKLIKVRLKHGWAGIGIFWAIIEALDRNSGSIEYDIDILTDMLSGAKPETIQSLINDFGLFTIQGGRFSSVRLNRDRGIREDAVANGSKGGKASVGKRVQPPPSTPPLKQGEERRGEEKEESKKEEPPLPPVAHTPRPERPDLPSYNPNGPRPPGWTDFDEQKLITGQEAKRAIKETLHVHNGGSVNGWKRIEAGCREWKALYQARDHYDRLEMPYSRCLDRVKAEYPDSDPIEKLKAITQAYVNDCQIHNRIKLSALNFIDGDRWKDDWSQTESESTANQGLCPDGSTWTRRPDGRYEVASKSGRKALMAEGWKP